MKLEDIKKTVAVFEKNFKEGVTSKEEFKANVEGVMMFVKIIEPYNQDFINRLRESYKNAVKVEK